MKTKCLVSNSTTKNEMLINSTTKIIYLFHILGGDEFQYEVYEESINDSLAKSKALVQKYKKLSEERGVICLVVN